MGKQQNPTGPSRPVRPGPQSPTQPRPSNPTPERGGEQKGIGSPPKR